MCLIFVALDSHSDYPLIVAANRDEFHARATDPAAPWPERDGPAQIVAGRDRVAGGTWMGLTRSGRFAALTNYRGPALGNATPPSRGALVSDFLSGSADAMAYCESLRADGHRYNGFSLLAYDGTALGCYSNRADRLVRIEPGVHGLSNHLLDTPWPKVVRGRQRVGALLQGASDPRALTEELFDMLTDAEVPADHELPDTGVGVERERALAPMFVLGEAYGTRSSTVLFVGANGDVVLHERSFDNHAREIGRVTHAWAFSDPGVSAVEAEVTV